MIESRDERLIRQISIEDFLSDIGVAAEHGPTPMNTGQKLLRDFAARVIMASGIRLIAGRVAEISHAGTSCTKGADPFLGAVRAAIREGQRLLKTNGLELVSSGEHLSLDLV